MIDEFTTPEITVAGRAGPAERRLKAALAVVLGLDRTVIQGLPRPRLYRGKTSGVMPALLTDDEQDSEKLVAQAGKILAALFNTRATLDVIFLSNARDAEISKVCPPFHGRKAHAAAGATAH